jgi:transketolase
MADKKATRDAYGEVLLELGKENESIVVLDADLSKSTKTNIFAKEFPQRFFNMGIAEQNMMGTAGGLSTCGKIPFASTFAIFATGRAFEQIRNTIAYPALNVKIAATHAGITVGEDGGSHQTIEDISLMRTLPNMTVIVPADAVETKLAVRAAVAMKGPVYIRLGRPAVPVIFGDDYRFEIGKAFLMRNGRDVAILATGIMVSLAIDAAEILSAEGITAAVLNVSTIKPLDTEAIIQLAVQTGCIVTAEEHSVIGGLGSAVAETISEHNPVPLVRVGIQDHFGESGTPAALMEKFELHAQAIAVAAREVIKKKSNLICAKP